MFKLSIAKQPRLTASVKFRKAAPLEILMVVDNINIGHFSYKNIFVDNSAEICVGDDIKGADEYCAQATHIKIQWAGYIVIGAITGWRYVNDQNIHISWVVDCFSSAISSGMITDARGLALRVNCDETDIFTNLQGEPWACADMTQGHLGLTKEINAAVERLEGMKPSADGVESGDVNIILTVSPAVIAYLGVKPFQKLGGSVVASFKIGSMQFPTTAITPHFGGFFSGVPLVFDDLLSCRNFIQSITSGAGFITKMSPNGVPGQSYTSAIPYTLHGNNSGATFTASAPAYPNTGGYPLEAIRPITFSDIYSVYAIPKKFCMDSSKIAADKAVFSSNLRNLGHLGRGKLMAGKARHIKLLAYPYTYYAIHTIAGDSVNIIPQTHYRGDTVNAPEVWVGIAFIGGDTPALHGYVYTRDSAASPLDNGTIADHFIIRNYPSLAMNLDQSLNIQMMREQQTARNAEASRTIASIQTAPAMLAANVVEAGARGAASGLAGSVSSLNPISILTGTAGGAAGGLISGAADAGIAAVRDGANGDRTNANIAIDRAKAAAGNMITPPPASTSGNTFALQIAAPPCFVYERGATTAERCAAMSYIDEQGQTVNSVINPITNDGEVLGGAAKITPVDGRTYYKMGNLILQGDLPAGWRDAIISLFMNGVWLLEDS